MRYRYCAISILNFLCDIDIVRYRYRYLSAISILMRYRYRTMMRYFDIAAKKVQELQSLLSVVKKLFTMNVFHVQHSQIRNTVGTTSFFQVCLTKQDLFCFFTLELFSLLRLDESSAAKQSLTFDCGCRCAQIFLSNS